MGDDDTEKISKRGANKKKHSHSRKNEMPQRNVMKDLDAEIDLADNQPSINYSSQEEDEPIEQFGDIRDGEANSPHS